MRLLLVLVLLGFATLAWAAEPVPIDAQWDWDHADVSEARFKDLLAQVGGDIPRQAEILTQIARAQGMQGHHDQAQQSLDRAAALQPAAGERARIRWLLEGGRLARQQRNHPLAIARFRDAAQAASGHWDGLAIDALHMLAVVDPDQGQRYTDQALAIIGGSKDAQLRGWYGPLYHNQAANFQDAGKYAEALAWHERDLGWRVATHAPAAEQRVARLGMASATRGLGRAADALNQVRQLLGQAKAEAQPDPWEIGTLEMEQGACLLALDRSADALTQLTAAQQALAPLFDADDERLKQELEADLAKAKAKATAAPPAAR